ncbi:DUF1707 domain-containing protein [Spongiactinospora sp. TRM90649]|uniref:DUF1707 SHOCT-like domain-containing protein n=1 Tax=Spongiactinospora sp. TRM90649 TaxID=3031114 RepID=UPI0023F7A669|nr:DUF1707 domain-containing protein [Spongiactinospora sp. TRM90649]MDF5758192.1 DUF1707 domain-containing protein [Spongiactinospora sp. TRM90649]
MENAPEHRDRRSQVRATDNNREQAATMLGEAMATGQLSHEEYSQRLDTLYAAKTLGELDLLTADLQLDRQVVPAPTGAPVSYAAPSGEQEDRMFAVFGGAVRKGAWRVRSRLRGLAMFGGIELDFSEAVFESRQIEVHMIAVFGGVEITVPEGVEVRSKGSGIFGGFDVRGGDTPDPSAPVLVVKGFAVFGGVGGRPRKRKR